MVKENSRAEALKRKVGAVYSLAVGSYLQRGSVPPPPPVAYPNPPPVPFPVTTRVCSPTTPSLSRPPPHPHTLPSSPHLAVSPLRVRTESRTMYFRRERSRHDRADLASVPRDPATSHLISSIPTTRTKALLAVGTGTSGPAPPATSIGAPLRSFLDGTKSPLWPPVVSPLSTRGHCLWQTLLNLDMRTEGGVKIVPTDSIFA